ncbi:hypothetical protein BMETH_741_1 [methanotrophic bacterial endosymbiont of Bathymodiolus sp.]|nr:hypothetical protein BMETH_741_1 [methanotrophic bacterial endosymbiont of Bathymodiolus sp.]
MNRNTKLPHNARVLNLSLNMIQIFIRFYTFQYKSRTYSI